VRPLSKLIETIAGAARAFRQNGCRHDWRPEGNLIVRPGRRLETAEQRYRCPKCGATRQEGIF
jgi:hypothetical protein